MATAMYGAQYPTSYAVDTTAQPDEQYITTFFCRALYDYQAQDGSSLSFHKNDIIEVLTQRDTGWWDGLLGDERGWFPSNYVTILSEQEAESALVGSEIPPGRPSVVDDGMVSMDLTMSTALSQSDPEGDWLNEHHTYSGPDTQVNGHGSIPASTNGAKSKHSDFWVPQVSADSQIYYFNTQTGQQSRDLPTEGEDEPDAEFASLPSQATNSRITPGAGLATVPEITRIPSDNGGTAGFGVPQRTRTPEPWVRRLADDGMSFFYWNRMSGQISKSFPEPDAPPAYTDDRTPRDTRALPSTSSTLLNVTNGSHGPSDIGRLRSDSSVSRSDDPNYSSDRFSIHSDDSGVQPRQRSRADTSFGGKAVNGRSHADNHDVQIHNSLQTSESLRQAMSPQAPQTPSEMIGHVREAISTVVESLRSFATTRRPEQREEVEESVQAVVSSVRNLLYISATPTGHIPSHFYPKNGRDSRPSTSSNLQTHIKPAHRKVAGTLSKLVLSALALQYDLGSLSSDKPNRMEVDAVDLERAVVGFVNEVQAFQDQHPGSNIKRLRGVFSPANIGPGSAGAGIGGSWKGFGYTPTDNRITSPPERQLLPAVVSEVKKTAHTVEERLAGLISVLSSANHEPERLPNEGRVVMTYLSYLLVFLGDLDLAGRVDLEGLTTQSGHSQVYSQYMRTVEQGRLLVRTLEVALQSLYDDGVTLFMALQQVCKALPQPRDERFAQYDRIDAVISAIRSNLNIFMHSLDAILAISTDQDEIGRGEFTDSGWRNSNISLVDGMGALSRHPIDMDPEEDVVDMELAFSRPGMRTLQSVESHGSSTLYHSSSHASEASLAMSDREGGAMEPLTPTWQEPSDIGLSSTLMQNGEGSPTLEEDPTFSKSPVRGDKLRKLLGPDAPQIIFDTLNASAKPWYLRPNYDQAEIMIDVDGGVRAGTPAALVERLTAHEHGDPTYIKNFLMTFKSFMTVDELFDLLVRRFWIEAPTNLSKPELDEWTALKQHIVRVRVLNTFKSMVTDDDVLEKEDMYILERMKEFASNEDVVNFAAAKHLLILIERAQKGGDAAIKTTNTMPLTPPTPIVPKNSKKLKLLDIDPLEIARQLTLLEATLYKKIRPMECLQRSRETKPGKTNDNITRIIQLSNRIANWVADSVLAREDSRKRAAVVKHFISVADRCRGMQNYSTMTAIVSGLNTPPIRRLKRTWEQVNARFMSQLGASESTIDTNKNFNNYRSTLAKISPPCVPFIGVYLTTLTFINDGAEDKLAGHMINFRKRQKAAEVIRDIKRWQAMPYNFQTVASVLGFLEDSFNKYSEGVDYGDQFWNLSLEREPREREDEKMARLLQESGFL